MTPLLILKVLHDHRRPWHYNSQGSGPCGIFCIHCMMQGLHGVPSEDIRSRMIPGFIIRAQCRTYFSRNVFSRQGVQSFDSAPCTTAPKMSKTRNPIPSPKLIDPKPQILDPEPGGGFLNIWQDPIVISRAARKGPYS